MDTAVRLGPLKFSLQAVTDHHGSSIHSGHYTASINCCKTHSIATITQLWSLELLTAKSPLLHMLYYINWLTYGFWTRTGGGSLIAPMALAHPLNPIDNRSRNRRRNLWVGWCVSSWWPFHPSRSSVLIYIYINIYIDILLFSSATSTDCAASKKNDIYIYIYIYQLCLALRW